MIVVSDTSPINYLVLTGLIDVLPKLYEQIIIPIAVREELKHPKALEVVKKWALHMPDWVSVQETSQVFHGGDLHRGEAAAIALAIEINADLLLADDTAARRAARLQGLAVIGTLGVLEAAANAGLLNLPEAVERLAATSYHISDSVLREVLSRHGEEGGHGDQS